MATTALAFLQRLPGGQEKWIRHGQLAVNLLLIILCAVALARVFWALWPSDDMAAPAAGQAAGNLQQSSKPVDVNVIYSNHLFGRAELKRPESKDDAPIDAPETRLNLTLTGIMAASDEARARALIKDGSGKQRPYGVGDDLPGGARLSAIHADRVILERAGRYETLRMEQKNQPGAAGQRRSASRDAPAALPGSTDITAETARKISEARADILRDPTKASQYIRVQPVYNQGQLKGYRVYPGKDRQLFKDVGLRAGELLTSVNGVQLDDPSKALQMLSDLSSATQVNVTLERAGRSRTLNLNMNQ